MNLKRRNFLKAGASAALAGMIGPDLLAQNIDAIRDSSGVIPKREFGKTGEFLSVVGLGGLSVMHEEQKRAAAVAAKAIERGVNYVDVAPAYGNGKAEEMMGKFLPRYRDKLFLACKTKMRDRKGAETELYRSLKRLKTDRFDLYQFHCIQDPDKDVRRAMADDGAMAAILDAKKKGLVRYIGVTAHSVEAALAAIETDQFDSVLLPVNFVCNLRGNGFDELPLKAAEKRKMARLAIKPMIRGKWARGEERLKIPGMWYKPIQDPVEAGLAVRWTLGRGVTSVLPPGNADFFEIALNVAAYEKPLEAKELAALKSIAEKEIPLFSHNPAKA